MVTPIASRSPSPVQQPAARALEVRTRPDAPPPAHVTPRSELPIYARRQHSLQQLPHVVLHEVFKLVSEDRKQLLGPMLASRHMHQLVHASAGHEVRAGKLIHQAQSLASVSPRKLPERLGELLTAMKLPGPRLRGDGLMKLVDVVMPLIMQVHASEAADGGVRHDPRPGMLNALVDSVLGGPTLQDRVAGFRKISGHFSSVRSPVPASVLQHVVDTPGVDKILHKTCSVMLEALTIGGHPAAEKAAAAQRIFDQVRDDPPLQGHERARLAAHTLRCSASLPAAGRRELFLKAVELVIAGSSDEDALLGLGEVMRTFEELPDEVKRETFESLLDRIPQYGRSEPYKAQALSILMRVYNRSHEMIGTDVAGQVLARIGPFAESTSELEALRHVLRYAAPQLGSDAALGMLSRGLQLSFDGGTEDTAIAQFKSLAPVLRGLPANARHQAFTAALETAWGANLSEEGKVACLRYIMKCVPHGASELAGFVGHALDMASELSGDAHRFDAIRLVLQHGGSLLDRHRALATLSAAVKLASEEEDKATATARFVSLAPVLPNMPSRARSKAFERALEGAWQAGLGEQGRLACLDAIMKQYPSSGRGPGFVERALIRAGEFPDGPDKLAALAAILGAAGRLETGHAPLEAMETALALLSQEAPGPDTAQTLARILAPAQKMKPTENPELFSKAAAILGSLLDNTVDENTVAAGIGTLLVASRFAGDKNAAIKTTIDTVRRLTRPQALLLASGRQGLLARLGFDQDTNRELARAASEAIVSALGNASPAAVEALAGQVGHAAAAQRGILAGASLDVLGRIEDIEEFREARERAELCLTHLSSSPAEQNALRERLEALTVQRSEAAGG